MCRPPHLRVTADLIGGGWNVSSSGVAGCRPVTPLICVGPNLRNRRINSNRRMPRNAGPTPTSSSSDENQPTTATQTAPSVIPRLTRATARQQHANNPQPILPHPVPPAPQQNIASTAVNPAQQYQCPYCDRSFPSSRGLGVHRRSAHPDEANEEVNVERVKKRWGDEELRLLAREEARALARGVRFVNQHLLEIFPDRTLEAIKGIRRRADYKDLVTSAGRDLDGPSGSGVSLALPDPVPGPSTMASSQLPPTPAQTQPTITPSIGVPNATMYAAIQDLIPAVQNIRTHRADHLVEIALRCLDGQDVSEGCGTWLQRVFPQYVDTRPPRRGRATSPVRISRKRQRRRDYANTQKLFKTNMSRAAKLILDGPVESDTPNVETMSRYWEPIMTQPSTQVPLDEEISPRPEFDSVWHPVTCDEVTAVGVPTSSAPGPDGITARQWRAVPASVRALLFNIVLAVGGFPQQLLMSRTVFVPKKAGSSMPAHFRPISITSVVVRQLHKILAKRLLEANIVDERQRCFEDGCAENIAVLATLLDDSRRHLRELHLVSLDVAKAFDSVSHCAITATLGRVGLPADFVTYVTHCYANSSTVLEVGGSRSAAISIQRGVRQGDPLSTIIFCLVVNDLLAAVPQDVGYAIGGMSSVNALAYADDIILIASSKIGMATSLKLVEAKARESGLEFNNSKSVALSIVPAGKQKTYKVLSEPQFHLLSGSIIPQLSSSQEWRYLGVDMRPVGPKRVSSDLAPTLDRITRAPLKPQQRLKILRCFMIPRYYHRLVLSGSTQQQLRSLDKQVRLAVRKWLRLPHDTPLGYFHAPVRLGGLGIPAFVTSVPGLVFERLSRLDQSSLPCAEMVKESDWVSSRLRWASKVLTKDGESLLTKESRDKWWAKYLYRSIDGSELREAEKTTLSTWWVDGGSYGVPGRDYVQYHHVRINCLPTRVRTSRGIRRAGMEVQCRAGCRVTETAAHVIQACHRTHGGRVKRHNAVCRVLASGLRNASWDVHEEPHFHTAAGLRKPDLVAVKEGNAVVIDAQVVSGATSLDQAHERKKQYYAANNDVVEEISRRHNVNINNIQFSSCTLSWRGIWACKSADFLLGVGLPRRLLAGITTRVLQGSAMNWSRWNRMTGLGDGALRGERARTGIG